MEEVMEAAVRIFNAGYMIDKTNYSVCDLYNSVQSAFKNSSENVNLGISLPQKYIYIVKVNCM